jgi:hypothetical protein
MAFFENSLIGYGLIPPKLTLTTEVSVYLLFIYSFVFTSYRHEIYRFHLLYPIGLFLIAALCSILLNEIFNYQPILSLRIIFRFYLFYLALINLGIKFADFKRINTLLFTLFIIQIPATAIKFYFLGFTEETMGTYGVRGGGLTPIIPIIAIGYLAGYYFLHKAKKVYILLGVGFFLLGVVGQKAVLFVLYPATFIGLYYLLFIRERRLRFVKNMVVFIIAVMISIGSSVTIISVDKRLNPEKATGGGSIDFSHALEKAKLYTIHTSEGGKYGSGRVATTKIAFETAMNDGFGSFFLGFGPGSFTKSLLKKDWRMDSRLLRIKRSYGVTGMVYVLIEYGIFGVIVLSTIFFSFVRMSWKWYNNETEPYWKAFSFGTVVFSFLYVFIFFAYNTAFIGDTLPPIYFYAMATMYIRYKETLKGNVERPAA